MTVIKNVLIVANPKKSRVAPVIETCRAELARRGIASELNVPAYFKTVNRDTLTDLDNGFKLKDYQLILSIGGDGTFLYTARTFLDLKIPVIGVNAGRMGFLTEVNPEQIGDALDKIVLEQVHLKKRTLLKADILRDGKERYRFSFLNDAVISKGSLSRMVEFNLRLDNEPLWDYRSDGLIVSTPTGSTAYNLAAGGPIITTDMSAMCITPICPHMLGVRPIVTGANRELTIEMLSEEEDTTLTIDGQENCCLLKNDIIRIGNSDRSVSIFDYGEKEFFEVLRKKLG
jgi:NAD+ kinase